MKPIIHFIAILSYLHGRSVVDTCGLVQVYVQGFIDGWKSGKQYVIGYFSLQVYGLRTALP